MHDFVSRAGPKLQHALHQFAINPADYTAADLGCSTGGFTDCLLRNGAARVYAIDTGYGVLDYTLRKDPRVIVMERTNAMHVTLPEPVDLVTIDVAWTRQKHILPSATRLLKPAGRIISLFKPHYEASAAELRKGILPDELLPVVLDRILADAHAAKLTVLQTTLSPIRGAKGNAEILALLTPNQPPRTPSHGENTHPDGTY